MPDLPQPPSEFLGFKVNQAWDYENAFYLTSGVERIGKLLAHADLYRMITSLPGQIVECGVFKGASLIRWATFRTLFEADHSRRILGFDAFGEFPRSGDSTDRTFIEWFESEAGAGISEQELRECLASKGFSNIDLYPGDILQSVEEYVTANPALRIALLHLDLDVYKPTMEALRHLWPCIVPGGILVIDDYGVVSGATRAVEDFLLADGITFQKLPFTHIPAYVVR